jgi:hypothetical protein
MGRPSADGDLGAFEVTPVRGFRWSAADPETLAYTEPVTILSRDLAHLLHDRAVVLAELERAGTGSGDAKRRGPWLFSNPRPPDRRPGHPA